MSIAIAYGLFLRRHAFPPTLHDLFTAVISVSAIAVGFLATAKTILLALEERPIIVSLKQSGYYKWLIAYILEAIYWSFALAGVSAAGLLLTFAKRGAAQDWEHAFFLAIWAFLLAGAGLSYFRVVRVLSKILRQAG
jgi:hypothetical protein